MSEVTLNCGSSCSGWVRNSQLERSEHPLLLGFEVVVSRTLSWKEPIMTEANLPQPRGFPHWQNSIEEAASPGLIDYFQVDVPGVSCKSVNVGADTSRCSITW